MRKLKLQLDDLAVQSFSPAPARGVRGTAVGHNQELLPAPDTGGGEPYDTEPGMNCFTCELSCRGC